MSDKDSVDPIPRSVNRGEARAVGIQLPNDGRMDALSLKFRQESEIVVAARPRLDYLCVRNVVELILWITEFPRGFFGRGYQGDSAGTKRHMRACAEAIIPLPDGSRTPPDGRKWRESPGPGTVAGKA